jgi:SAM-dependent methyltransferase
VDRELWSAYDAMGSAFQEHAADSPYNAHYDRPAVLAALEPVAGLRILDAGCGPGFYAQELADRGADVTAFDASAVMVSLARARLGGRAVVDRAVLGAALPYPDYAFDLIVCALAIHYADDRGAAFTEFFRVLRPGGALVISTQHPVMDWLRKGGSYFDTTLETDTWRTPYGGQRVRFWREPLSALCTAATGAGFLIEKVIEPLPTESMRERYPDDYQKLTAEPGFLILRLVKLASHNAPDRHNVQAGPDLPYALSRPPDVCTARVPAVLGGSGSVDVRPRTRAGRVVLEPADRGAVSRSCLKGGGFAGRP